MNKDKIKRKYIARTYDPSRAAAITWTSDKHLVSKEYVRAILNGTSQGGRSEEILRDFRAKYSELKRVLS